MMKATFPVARIGKQSSGSLWMHTQIKVRLKNKNQSLVDPDQFFNRDHDRDENFEIKA
nr:hypothetical protein [uncultured Methanoregula sp.]